MRPNQRMGYQIVSSSGLPRKLRWGKTDMIRIDLRDLDDITPVNELWGLVLQHLICQIVESLKFISRVDEDLVRPRRGVVIINTVFPFCHQAEVMPCAPNGPE